VLRELITLTSVDTVQNFVQLLSFEGTTRL
jgi:hypothetical protein